MSGRKIAIDKSKCDGCGLCVNACHEGALALVDGKAELVREDFCDGLGDCLPACPRDAISFTPAPSGSPSGHVPMAAMSHSPMPIAGPGVQWPVQLALVPPRAAYFKGTLVVAADCTAFAAPSFKESFIQGNPVVVGCPKLDDRVRFEKLKDIISSNPIDGIRVIRMEVPCCSAIIRIVDDAVAASGRDVPVEEVIISRSGKVLGSE